MAGPLAGISVLDLSRTSSGAYATMILGDLGADVIRIDCPGPDDEWRADLPGEGLVAGGFLFSLQANKRRICVNLQDPRGLAVAQGLAQRADVLVEDWGPGSAARVGLGYPKCSGANPGLVYCSVSPFGDDGPYRDLPASDALIQALSGVMRVTAEAGGVPVPIGVPVSHASGALYAAQAVLAALYARQGSGRGQHVEIALLDALISLWATKAAKWLATAEVPQPLGTENPNRCPSELFRTADGRYIYLTAGNDRQWRLCCEALGFPEMADDPAYATNAARVQRRKEVNRRIQGVLAGRSLSDWLQHFERFGSLCAPFLSLAEALAQPQVASLGTVGQLRCGEKRFSTIGSPLHLSATPPVATRTCAAPGANTASVLRDIVGCEASEVEALRCEGVVVQAGDGAESAVVAEAKGSWGAGVGKGRGALATSRGAGPAQGDGEDANRGPLCGIVVLDFTRVLSGPFCTMLLGDLGAEVIKVESPGGGDESRTVIPYAGRAATDEDYFYPMNRNKMSVTINLKTPEGRKAALALARSADVVVENYAVGVAQRLGVDYEALRQVNPSLVYCSISGFGQTGPLRNVRTYDTNVQAMTGIMDATRTVAGVPLLPGLFLGDLSAGLYATLGVLTALYHRRGTGVGQYVDISMLESLLSWWLTRRADGALGSTGLKPGCPLDATHLLSRAFPTADGGYVHVTVAEPEQWDALCAFVGHSVRLPAGGKKRSDVDEAGRDTLERVLADHFVRLSRDEAAAQLLARGVPAAKVLNLEEVAADPHVVGRQVFVGVHHPHSGRIRQIMSPFRFSETPASIRRGPPLLGEHTRAVLARYAHLAPDAVEAFVRSGVVTAAPEAPQGTGSGQSQTVPRTEEIPPVG